MTTEKLYEDGPQTGVRAPILVTHFEGAMDAGSAGTLAVVQMLRSLSPQRVATFDTDKLIDYRSHRPVMIVENWVTREVVVPEIALDLVHDDAGTPILILHGPEPDARWETFTKNVADLAKQSGVEAVVSFHGIPAAVPHTRPIAVHVQSTDEDLVPPQPTMGATLQFPAPISTFMHYRFSEDNLHGISLIAAVPYYMADSSFPRAGSALLSKLAQIADLSLPIGDLERGADEDASQVNLLVGQNPEIERTVKALEQHFDSMVEGEEISAFGQGVVFLDGEGEMGTEMEDNADSDSGEEHVNEAVSSADGIAGLLSLNADGQPTGRVADKASDASVAEAIGDAVEKYLRSQMKIKPSESETFPDEANNSSGDSDQEPSTGHQPRHRAPRPWETGE